MPLKKTNNSESSEVSEEGSSSLPCSKLQSVIVRVPTEPPVYNGRPSTSAREWLRLFLRAASLNEWSDDHCLKTVEHYLSDLAVTWHVSLPPVTLTDWAAYQKCFNRRFNRVEVIRAAA